MKEINLQFGNYLFIEVDSDSYSHSLTKFKNHAVINYKRKLTGDSNWSDNIGDLNSKLLDYKIISTTKDITEKQTESIVHYHVVNDTKYYSNYMPYKSQDFRDIIDNSFKTAKESINSLIQANGLDVNKTYLILKKTKIK